MRNNHSKMNIPYVVFSIRVLIPSYNFVQSSWVSFIKIKQLNIVLAIIPVENPIL